MTFELILPYSKFVERKQLILANRMAGPTTYAAYLHRQVGSQVVLKIRYMLIQCFFILYLRILYLLVHDMEGN